MKPFEYLILYGVAILGICLWLGIFFLWYGIPEPIQIGWFTILAEGFGFIGLSLVELTIFF